MSDFKFPDAPVKREGQPVTGWGPPPEEPKIKTTWIEMRIPEELEDECEAAIRKVLRDHGYDKGWINYGRF